MPKLINNGNYTQENKLFPSTICSLISQGKVSTNQTYGCSTAYGCISNPDKNNCHYDDCVISQCRKISTLDACQKRTDANADQVCEWKNDYFCISTPSTSEFRGEYYEALKWAVSRNKFEESINVTNLNGNVVACCNEAGCRVDNGVGCGVGSNVTTGDLFAKTYIHNFKNNVGESFDRHPLGEVCEGFVSMVTTSITFTSTLTTTEITSVTTINSSNISPVLVPSLATSIPATTFLGAVMILAIRRFFRGNWW